MPSSQPPGAPLELVFAPFRLDVRNEQLFDGDRLVPLRPKTFAVLRCLIDRRGLLVTKDEIMDTVWPEVSVSDSVLKVCVREIREALRDDSGTPRYIETAHRRGYRFIADASAVPVAPADRTRRPLATSPLAGRSREFVQLHSSLARAIGGERVITFVTGEPGIGKTALVEALLTEAAARRGLLAGRGQCVEHYGASEAYLPVFEALSHLCSEPGSRHIVATLARYAPTWLAQMPAIDGAHAALERALPSGSPARMLREMADAIEAITADTPLLLVLEDLHWSDPSTIGLIAYLARRREPARVLIVGTYRPSEATTGGHPLRGAVQELLAHGACEELPLPLLDERAIADYLAVRFPGHQVTRDLTRTLHRHTGGNPLFMVGLVDYLVERGALVAPAGASAKLELRSEEPAMPKTVGGLIDRQIDLLEPYDRGVLEVASVAGLQFTAAEVAAAVEGAESDVEAAFERLARHHHFLDREAPVELPDGMLTARFRFVHALHQNAFYERVPLGRRTERHLRIGEWLERRFGERAGELASALAMHFEQGRDHRRAVRYCRIASETAQQRFATDEAIRLATRGLALLEKTWPTGADRDHEELALRIALGVPLLAARGFSASEVERTFRRALDLSHHACDASLRFPIIAGLYGFYLIRADLGIARQLTGQLLQQARAAGSPEMLAHAHWAGLVTALNEGRFAEAHDHFAAIGALLDRVNARAYLMQFGQDAESTCRAFGAWALWSLGQTEAALDELQAARSRAASLAHPHSLCFSHFFSAFLAQMRRMPAETRDHATTAQREALEHGFPQWIAFSTILRGWARALTGEPDEGIAELEQGLATFQAIGGAISMPHFMALHAEVMAASGRLDCALNRVLDAVAEARRTGGCYYDSEILRLEAEIRLRRGAPDDETVALMRLEEAVETARRQGAVPFQRRARESLAALR